MKTYKFPSKNEYMYEVSSKSENGKMVKFRGKIFWGGISQRGGILKKKMKTYKMWLQNKPIYEISSKSDNGKVVKFRGKSRTYFSEMRKSRLHAKMAILPELFFDAGFGICSVGTPEILPYTKSEQPRITEKRLPRHAKNGYTAVATLSSRASLFFWVSATASAVAR